MKKKIAGILVAATAILTLATGCGETPFSPSGGQPPLPPGKSSPTEFGLVEVTISGLGTEQMSARAVSLTPKTAFSLSSPVSTTNTALKFDGVDDYITANGVAADLGSSAAFTLEAWVKPETASGGGEAILGFHTGSGDNRNILFYNPNSNSFSYYDASVGFISTPGSFSSGNWYHIAVTVDASNQGRLYINGHEEVTFTTTVRPDAAGSFSIGQEYDGSSPGNFFNGRIDEVRIWNVVRSQTQLQTNMNAILTPPLTGLVSYYPFNETTGATASDAAGDNDGTLNGGPVWGVTGPALEGTFSGGDGTIQIEPITHGSFTYGERGNGGMRYVFATFKVRNAQLDGTVYNTPRQNLTFLAVNSDQTYGNTAVYSMHLFNNDPIPDAAAEAMADSVIPTGNAGLVSHTEIEPLQPDVLQAFTETEVQNMEDKLPLSSTVTDIFPYGFVTRSPGVTPGSRKLPNNPGPDQFDGLVTFAFKLPLQSQSNKDPFEITMLFLPIDDSETRITESPVEQTPGADRVLWDRVNKLSTGSGRVSVTLLGSSSTSIRGHEVRRLCNVRTAGTASSPVTMLADFATPCNIANPLPSNVILVDADAPQGGDGFTWATAFNDLQDALYAVRSHADLGEPYEHITEIWVAEGAYYPDEGLNVTNDNEKESFHLVEGIKLYGGFTGSEYLREQRDPYAHATILSGDMTQNDNNADGNHISESINDRVGQNTEHVLSVGRGPSITRATLLDGFIITAGFNFSGGAGFECFAIGRDTECSPVFRNVTFSGNRSKFGGAVYIKSEGYSAQASPLFVDVRFTGNWAGFGGAIYNEAEEHNSKANPVFVRTVFIDNTVARDGGAVANYIRTSGYATEAIIYFYNCKFEGNEAVYDSGFGRGGALYSEYGQFVVVNSSFENNQANVNGSAIYCSYNSTTACLHLYNVTVTNNTTNDASGKVIESNAPIKLDNVIIWGNTPAGISSYASGYANNSIIEGGCPPNVTCTGVLNQDPLFVGGLQLSGVSPAVDAGNNSFVSSSDPYDMDNDGNTSENLPDLNGNPRIVDSDNNGTAIVDMGAYEVQ